MSENKKKESFMAIPIENHETAAWIESTKNLKPKSNVVIPNETDVQRAKDWIDKNEL